MIIRNVSIRASNESIIFSPDALVISLGVDTYEKDPISK
jgi:acetoin utilization deacetylase AcuC-like enzyme